jgi:phosphatidylglycerophosphatase A
MIISRSHLHAMTKPPPPPLSFLFRHPAHLIACGLGSGLSRFAPGTAGTAFAWLTYPLLRQGFPADSSFGLFLLLMFAVGVPACHITGRNLGVVDHGSIVWDEVVPFWTVLMLTPAGFFWQLAAFLLFRGFDIAKPQPAFYFDQQVKNGFGVMMDDVVAAAYTLFVLASIRAVAGAWAG